MQEVSTINIVNDFSAHTGENDNWSCRIDFDPESREVRIYDYFGNGQSMATFNGTERAIGSNSHCNVNNIEDLVEFLESDQVQGLLAEIADGYETFWDGSNHRGRLSADADVAEDELRELISDWFNTSAACFYSADEWFHSSDVVAEMMRGDHDIESYVAEQEAKAEVGQVDEDDLTAHVRSELEKQAESEDSDDLDKINFARRALDMTEVTTLWAEWEKFDEDSHDGVTFERITLNGNRYVEVDDRDTEWIADEDEFDAEMNKVRELPSDHYCTEKREEGWWYTVLCSEVSNVTDHDQELAEAYDAYRYGTGDNV